MRPTIGNMAAWWRDGMPGIQISFSYRPLCPPLLPSKDGSARRPTAETKFRGVKSPRKIYTHMSELPRRAGSGLLAPASDGTLDQRGINE